MSTKQFGGLDTSDRLPGGSSCSRHIASGQFNDNGIDEDIKVSRRYTTNTTNTSDDYTDDNNCNNELDEKTTQDMSNPYEVGIYRRGNYISTIDTFMVIY